MAEPFILTIGMQDALDKLVQGGNDHSSKPAPGLPPVVAPDDNGLVRVVNRTGAEVKRWSVWAVSGTGNLSAAGWRRGGTFDLVAPDRGDHRQQPVVLLQALKDGRCGFARVCGVMPVEIIGLEEGQTYADFPEESADGYLRGVWLGRFRIILRGASDGGRTRAWVSFPSFFEPIIGVLTCDVPESGCNVTVKFAKLENCEVVGVGEEFEIDTLPPDEDEQA